MTDYSVKEVQALVTRAARGSYMPWGLAEEAATAVAWLEHNQIAAVQSIVDLLTINDGIDPADLAPDFSRDRGDARTCPIMTGAYLSDLRGANLSDTALVIRSVNAPILMLPHLVWIARDLGRSLGVQWGRVRAHVSGDGLEITSGREDVDISTHQDVTISYAPAEPKLSGATAARVEVSTENGLVLERFIYRTYLPESEQSKASGAGGGRVDDD